MPGRILRHGYTLRAAVMGSVVLPVLLVSALLGWSVLAKLEAEVAERMKEDLELIARSLQEPVGRALEKEREGAVSEALESALGFSRVYGAYIYDTDGQRIASSGPRAGRLDKGQVSELAETGAEQGRFDQQGDERLYSYFVPLVDSGGRIAGLLQLTRRGSDFDAYIQQIRWQGAAALLIIALLMGTVVFTGHHRAVGRHFQHIRTVLERVGAGERDLRLTEAGPREVRDLSTAFNHMLDRIHASERALAEQRREPVERAVRAAVHNAEEEAQRRGITLEAEGPDPGPILAMDRLRLEQAMDNLLRNALQVARSRVRTRWEADGDEVRLQVEDDGPGLDPDAAARLFEPFYTTKPVGEGTGLGLAVVHGAVREHGGRVEADTSPDLGGARFTLTLPLGGASEEETP